MYNYKNKIIGLNFIISTMIIYEVTPLSDCAFKLSSDVSSDYNSSFQSIYYLLKVYQQLWDFFFLMIYMIINCGKPLLSWRSWMRVIPTERLLSLSYFHSQTSLWLAWLFLQIVWPDVFYPIRTLFLAAWTIQLHMIQLPVHLY